MPLFRSRALVEEQRLQYSLMIYISIFFHINRYFIGANFDGLVQPLQKNRF